MKSIPFSLAFMVFAIYAYGENEPNNSLAQANNMVYNSTQTGNLSGTDNEDWFLINLPQGGVYTITIKKTGTGNGTLNLYDGEKTGNPQVTYIGLNYGNSPAEGWTLTFPLLSGKYYLKIVKNSGEINYEISGKLVLPAFKEDDEPNDTITKALNVQAGGTINGTLHYYAPGKGKDERDWYKVEIKTAAILKIKLHKKGAGQTTMYFRDENILPGKAISNFYLPNFNSPAEGYSWNFAVLAGTYWILINGGDGEVDYQLVTSLEKPAWPEDKENNDSIGLASEFLLNDSISGVLYYYKPGIGLDQTDYYKIVTPDYGHLSIHLSKKGIYGSVKLTDKGKDIITQGFTYGDANYTISKLLPAGTYYLVFQHSSNWLQYKAAMKFTPKPTADFSFLNDGFSIAFDNTTRFGETFSWNFDDGTKSTQVNPYHNFSKPGEYDVCLIASNVAGKDTACSRVTIPGAGRYFPHEGGNTGDVTVEVHGGGLDTSFVGNLKQGSETIARSEYTYIAGKGAIKLTFNLREKPEGIFDLVLEKKGGPSYLFPGGFKIVTGTKSDPWVSISGRNRMLFNNWTTYTINYGNNGNVDAILTPVWLVLTGNENIDIDLNGVRFINPDSVSILSADTQIFVELDSVHPKVPYCKAFPFIFPSIAAKSVNSFTIRIKSNNNFEVHLWTERPWFRNPFDEEKLECYKKLLITDFNRHIVECYLEKFPFYFEALKMELNKELFNRKEGWMGGIMKATLFSAAIINKILLKECEIYDEDIREQLYKLISMRITRLYFSNIFGDFDESYRIVEGDYDYHFCIPEGIEKSDKIQSKSKLKPGNKTNCNSSFVYNYQNSFQIKTVSSLDPNEKTGLYGFGPDNFTAGVKDLSYTVFFENLATATAPAHTISIADQLDKSKFDISSFSFGNIKVGDSLIYIQPGQKSFVVNKLFSNRNTVARITGEIDTLTGMVEWKFRSLDPVTLAEIEDPDVGLLPPNLVSPEGEGNVSFSVELKKDPVHGEIVTNNAAIVFDANPDIQTNQHKITFDLNAPESKVLPLAASTTSNEFEVKWSGSDQGSGMQTYNIFVSANDEPYMLWMGGTTQTSAKFKSSSDKVYKFISIAADNVGNREIVPDVADAEISVVTDIFNPETGKDEFSVFPVPAKKELFFRIPLDGNFRITVYASDGRQVFQKPNLNLGLHKIDITSMKRGLYLWNITDEKNSVRKSGKFVK